MRLDHQLIDKLVKDLDNDAKALKEELLRMCWYMRGGLSYNESYLLTPDEREIISKIVEDNLKVTKDSGLPYF